MKIKFTRGHVFSILIANMIGTGAFTTLGYQVMGISSGFALLLLWVLGGVVAFLGSMCYAMLGIALPRSGGEYNYLSQIYGSGLGFVAGWVSLVIGFAAPIAAASLAFGDYLNKFINPEVFIDSDFQSSHFYNTPLFSSILLVLILTSLNIFNKKIGADFQKIFTIIKVIIILALIVIGLCSSENTEISFAMSVDALQSIVSPAFFIAMFFVAYSYSGWNAACYISGEIQDVERTLPRSLLSSTLLVTLLYVLLNYVFLKVVPISEMSGGMDIGYLFANKIFGVSVGGIMALAICVLLISTTNSMIIVGPRVSLVMGEDYKRLRFLSILNKREVPFVAILVQSMIAIIYLLTSTFESLLIFIGFVLSLISFLTVLGIFLIKEKDQLLISKFKSFGYPIVPALFLIINFTMLIYGLIYKPNESLFGIFICIIGYVVYMFISPKKDE